MSEKSKFWLRILSWISILTPYVLVFLKMRIALMEQKKSQTQKSIKIPQQRKTTLKWGDNGELSSIDMARILDRLNHSGLTECEIPLKTEKEKK